MFVYSTDEIPSGAKGRCKEAGGIEFVGKTLRHCRLSLLM